VATHSANPGSIVRSAAPHFGPASESLVDLLHQTRPNDNMFTGRTAISVEFVCKPNQAQRVCALIPKAINETFAGLSGFAGCALMVSDHEERLITVLTFWHGERRSASLNENARWVCKLPNRTWITSSACKPCVPISLCCPAAPSELLPGERRVLAML